MFALLHYHEYTRFPVPAKTSGWHQVFTYFNAHACSTACLNVRAYLFTIFHAL
jgi:hypothetical protein